MYQQEYYYKYNPRIYFYIRQDVSNWNSRTTGKIVMVRGANPEVNPPPPIYVAKILVAVCKGYIAVSAV